MNTASKIAKETTVTFSGLVYGNFNRYLYSALLARWVGAEFLGIYSLANAIMLISEVVAKMGLETGAMRFVSRLNPELDQEKIQKIIASALRMTTIFSLVIMVALIISSGAIVKNILNEPPLLKLVIIIFAIAIPFNALTLVSAFATQGFKRLKYKILVTQFLNPTLLLTTMVICYWFISAESALMAPMLITGIIGFFVMLGVLKKVTGVSNNQIMKAKVDTSLFNFSYPLMFVTILQTFMHWMDILMLGYFTDATTVGLYHPAARTAGLLQALLLSFISIYAPMMAQFHREGDRKKMDDTYKLVSRWLLMCAIPISAIFIIFPGKVMLLFGPEYLPSAKILVILTGATFIQAIFGAAGPTLSMSGHTKLVLWNTIGAFALNFGLNIFLIPNYGIIGAAIATLTSLIVVGFARTIEVGIILKMNFFDRKVIKPIFAGIMVFTGLFLIKDFIMPFHTLTTLLSAGIFSVGSFGLIMWMLKIEDEDSDFFKGLSVLKGRK
ncbi:MAG: oligosaccharide flippase family protein [Candidatus Marinimicrobia bacterium]|nr:oligosaccharide flippase family protein [Candidatus Neomarinimicrobiota bacterium]